MAIKQSLLKNQTEIKYPFPEAYLKIDDVKIKLKSEHNNIWIDISIFANEESRNTEKALAVNKDSKINTPITRYLSLV